MVCCRSRTSCLNSCFPLKMKGNDQNRGGCVRPLFGVFVSAPPVRTVLYSIQWKRPYKAQLATSTQTNLCCMKKTNLSHSSFRKRQPEIKKYMSCLTILCFYFTDCRHASRGNIFTLNRDWHSHDAEVLKTSLSSSSWRGGQPETGEVEKGFK